MAIISNWQIPFDTIKLIQQYFELYEYYQKEHSNGTIDLYPLAYIVSQLKASLVEDNTLRSEVIADLDQSVNSFSARITEFKTYLIKLIERTFTSLAKTTGIVRTSDIELILSTIRTAMLQDGQSIAARTVTIDPNDVETTSIIRPVTVPRLNTGNGKLLYTLYQPSLFEDTQIALREKLRIQCVRTTTAGQEQFQLTGETRYGRADCQFGGSGNGPTLTVAGNTFTNWQFDSWSTATPPVPTAWTIAEGTLGFEVYQHVDNAVTKFRGLYSLRCDLSKNIFRVSQTLSSTLKTYTNYVFGCWIFKPKIPAVTGTLHFEFYTSEDTQETLYLNVTDKLEVDVATLNYGWNFCFFIFHTSGKTRNWTLNIRRDDTPGSGFVLLNGIQLAEMLVHNTISWAILAGSIDFAINDEFGSGSNDHRGIQILTEGGRLQAFMGRLFEQQLPTSSEPTIADTPELAILAAASSSSSSALSSSSSSKGSSSSSEESSLSSEGSSSSSSEESEESKSTVSSSSSSQAKSSLSESQVSSSSRSSISSSSSKSLLSSSSESSKNVLSSSSSSEKSEESKSTVSSSSSSSEESSSSSEESSLSSEESSSSSSAGA